MTDGGRIPPLRGNDGSGGATTLHVIPSVAEESKSLEMESTAGISDSSATLGMTWRNGRNAILQQVQDERKGKAG